ncbi:MAG: CDP-alcohol phosphatidyltransferase family protein [Rhodospirillales bacterium]
MSHNTHIHKIAELTMRPLADTALRPNHVTTARLLTGIAAAGCLAVGQDPWPLIGGGLFVVSVILDRADGVLARMTDRMSPGGHLYDLIADAACNTLILIGLGVGLRHSDLGALSMLYGLIAGFSVAAILWMVMKIENMAGYRAAELPSYAGFDVDDLVLLIPIGVWAGWSKPILLGGAVIAPVVALIFAAMLLKRLRAAKAAQAPNAPE